MITPDKKREILKAASECFARYGYDKTTLEDIGRRVGLNKASLYYYYKNKETIFSEVIFFEAEEYFGNVLNEVGKVEGYKEKLLTYLTKRLEFIRYAVNYHKLTLMGVKDRKPLLDELYIRYMEQEEKSLAAILNESVAKGELADCDTARIAKSILAVTEAIKNKSAHCTDCNMASEISYSGIAEDVVFTVSLILDGLKK